MYLSVLFTGVKDKPTGTHEVEFVIAIGWTNYKISCPKEGEEGEVYYKKRLLNGELIRVGAGGGGNRGRILI